jgi:hypothetical protein
MAIYQISRIQVRSGKKGGSTGVPQLATGEFAWAVDSQELFIGNGPLFDGAPEIGNTRILTEHDMLSAPVTSVNGMTGDVVIDSATAGIAVITDVTFQDGGSADQITNRVRSNNEETLDACTVWTENFTVLFLATTGSASLVPDVQINVNDTGWQTLNSSNFYPSADKSVWYGSYDIDEAGSETIVAIRHIENPSVISTCTITSVASPEIDTFEFTGAYPGSQTQYSEDQQVNITVTSIEEFVAVEFEHTAFTAAKGPIGEQSTGGAVTTFNTAVTVANRGNTTQSFPAWIRIKNSENVWSEWRSTDIVSSVDHVNLINLNNSLPSISYGGISYTAGQAIKTSAGGNISGITYSNVTDVEFASTQVTISDPTVIEASKTIGANAAVYNITSPNINIALTNANNGRTATANWLVNIANIEPTVTITKPSGRYQTGKGYTAVTSPIGSEYAAAPSYTITIISNQQLLQAPELTASKGVFQGSWVTSDGGFTWNRVLKILDGVALGAGALTDLTVRSLSDEQYITATPANGSYTVGGFASRSGKFPAQTAIAAIGTYVSDFSNSTKLIITVGEVNSTYVGNADDVPYVPGTNHTVTIADNTGAYDPAGNYLRINEPTTVINGNTEGQLGFTIEEQA